MGALRPECPVGGHRVLIWPQESNIDRGIDKCWHRIVSRNTRFVLRLSVSSTVDMDSSTWDEMYSTRSVLYFSQILHDINLLILCLELWLIRDSSLEKFSDDNTVDNTAFDTWILTIHHICTSEWTQNQTTPLKIPTGGLNRYIWRKGQR